jgi:sialidase-1
MMMPVSTMDVLPLPVLLLLLAAVVVMDVVEAATPPRWTAPPPQMPGIELWRQRNTGTGCLLSPDGRACLPPVQPATPSGDCRGVQAFHSGGAPTTARFWRWVITATHDGAGPTIHYLQFGSPVPHATHPDWTWITNSSGWTVNASAQSNGPAANLIDYGADQKSGIFWNADQPPGCPTPWVATIDAGEAGTITADSMRYSIFDSAEAPLAFVLKAANSTIGSWHTVLRVANASNGNCQHDRGPPKSKATDSYGLADYFLALAVGVSHPRPSLLVFTEARKFSDEDWGAKSIAMRRSFDGGRTWQTSVDVVTDPPQVGNLTGEFTKDTKLGPFDGEGYDGISLGAVTLDKQTNRVFVHYQICAHPCKKYGCQRPHSCGPDGTGARMYYVSSNTSFGSWDAPVETTHMLQPWSTFSPGPGEGVQAASGRLIICGYYNSGGAAVNNFGSAFIVSDTHGVTWRTGGKMKDVSSLGTNECDAAMLANNSVLVTFRVGGGFRYQARSDDEGDSFVADSVRVVHDLPAPGCQGSMISSADGTLYFSGPMGNSRANMTVSRSTDSGESFHVIQNVYRSYAGYNSLAFVPPSLSTGPGHKLFLAYNRGWDGDGCKGDACPYSTTISFTTVPTTPTHGVTGTSDDQLTAPEVQQTSEDGRRSYVDDSSNSSSSNRKLLSLGWWRDRQHFPPDSPGLLDGHDKILIGSSSPACTDGPSCIMATNFTESLFGTASPTQPLRNGSTLDSLYALLQFGRERWNTSQKFLIVEEHRSDGPSLWDAVVADAYTYMQTPNNPPVLLDHYAHGLCSALKAAKLDWWMYDVDSDNNRKRTTADGPGSAQVVRYLKETCKSKYGISLTLGWVLRGNTGQSSYIAQNWTTYWPDNSQGAYDAMVNFVDLFLPMTYQLDTTAHYLSNGGAAYPGECSTGVDEQLMEYGHWSSANHIPFSKLVPGIGLTSVAATQCPANFRPGIELQYCMPSMQCKMQPGWTAAGNNSNAQAVLYAAVLAGHMTVIYDNWAQQSLFVGATNANCVGCVNYVDSMTARDFDFRLRHLQWRGARGFFTDAVESDYEFDTQTKLARHWNQPTEVLAQFEQSDVFVLNAGRAAAAAGGLDGSSGDSLCRLFGARIAATADVHRDIKLWSTVPFLARQYSREHGFTDQLLHAKRPGESAVLGAPLGAGPSAVACWGNTPTNPWPFKLGTHVHAFQDEPAVSTPESATGEVYQLTTQSMANLSAPFDIEAMATDPTYKREVPITSDAARVLAAALGGTVATEAQVRAAAAAGAAWEQLGSTQNERYATSWVDKVGTAPRGSGVAVVRSAVKVFDGGARALGAVNVFGTKVTVANSCALSAGCVFLIRPWNSTAWFKHGGSNTLKTDDVAPNPWNVGKPTIGSINVMLDYGKPSAQMSSPPAAVLESALAKPRPLTPYAGGAPTLHLHAARNEVESFLVVVNGGRAGLTGVAIDLAAPSGPIGAATLFAARYVNATKPSGCSGAAGLWADPLVPDTDVYVGERRNAFPLTVPPGQSRFAWVDIFVSANATAGTTTHAVAVTAGGGFSARLRLRLTVFGFALPTAPSMASIFGHGADWDRLRKAHGTRSEVETARLAKRYLQCGLMNSISFGDFLAYGSNSTLADAGAAAGDGFKQFVAEWGEFIQGAALPFGPSPRALSAVRLPAQLCSLGFDEHTGTFINCTESERHAQVDYWRDLARNFDGKGWLPRLFDFTVDEASCHPQDGRWDVLHRRAPMVKEADPRLRVLVTTTAEAARNNSADQLIDVYVPVINYLAPKQRRNDKDGRSCLISCLGESLSGDQRPSYDFLAPGNFFTYQACMSYGCGANMTCGELSGSACELGWPSMAIDHVDPSGRPSGLVNRAMESASYIERSDGEL